LRKSIHGHVFSEWTHIPTGRTWSYPLPSKAAIPKKMLDFVQELNDKKKEVKYVRCDDAGENKKTQQVFSKLSTSWIRNIKFEFTSRDSPQLNGKVEARTFSSEINLVG
jgi:hypothetical protein